MSILKKLNKEGCEKSLYKNLNINKIKNKSTVFDGISLLQDFETIRFIV